MRRPARKRCGTIGPQRRFSKLRLSTRLLTLIPVWLLTCPVFAGYLFVGNGSSGEVNRYDATTGAYVSTLTVPGGSGFTGGLAVSGGSLFLAGLDDNAIFRFDANSGAYLGIFVSGLNGPSGITFGPDGNLYVANQGGGSSSIDRYDGTTGAFVSTFVAPGAGPLGGLFNPQGIAFGPDGNLYVSDLGNGAIARFNGTTAAYTGFVDAGNPPSPLSSPYGLVFGPDGNLYVADPSTSTVHRYNGSTGAFIDEFVDLAGGLVQPIGLAFGPDGNLYVSDGMARVASFDGSSGAVIGDFVSVGSGGLSNPQFLAFSSDVPEPATGALLGAGLLLGWAWKRRR